MDNRTYVFISYAHRDSEVVLPCVEAMKRAGISLWYDEGIEAGSEWPEFIAQKVVGCAKFVLFISRAYLESQNCKRELNFAISRKKDILSVFLEDVELSPGMEMQLGTYQAIYRKRFDTPEQFYESICHEHYFDTCRLGDTKPVESEEQPRGPEPGGKSANAPNGDLQGGNAGGGQPSGYPGGGQPSSYNVGSVNDGYGNGYQPGHRNEKTVNDGYGDGYQPGAPKKGGKQPQNQNRGGQPSFPNGAGANDQNRGQQNPFSGAGANYQNGGQPNPFPGAGANYQNGGRQNPFPGAGANYQSGGQQSPYPNGGFPPAQNGMPTGNPYYPPVQPMPQRSRVVAFLLALLLGVFGIQKFYLRQPVWGVVYLLFCATYIPFVLSLIEGFVVLFASQEKLAKWYKCRFTS